MSANPKNTASNAPLNRVRVAISVSHDPAINYAFQQNAIPVLRELVVRNDRTARRNLKITIRTEPAFAESTELHVQSLEPEAEFKAGPLDLKLSPSFLENVTEQVAGYIHVEVTEGDVAIGT